MIHVLYHASCSDGFGAAWAAWKALGECGVTYRPVRYGEPIPWVGVFGDAYILDFSWPREQLACFLSERKGLVTILDHHKTAEADLAAFANQPRCDIFFDLAKSGAVLAWEHFHPGRPVPRLLEYVQDRDLWRFDLHQSQEISAWLRSWPFDFETWDCLAQDINERFSDVADQGQHILRFQAIQVGLMCDDFRWVTLGGYRVPAANATVFFSEVGEELCRRHPEAPFAAYWLDRADRLRHWGLRSNNGFDVSEVAKALGGGGHPSAAGFTESIPQGR